MTSLTKHDTTSEWATAHFDRTIQLSDDSDDLIDTMRNQLHRFLEGSAAREPGKVFPGINPLPAPDVPDHIEKAIASMTVKEIKTVLSELQDEIIRLTAVRALVIATKKEIKKVVNS